ncbi:MAG TPA: DtxR family transcriptional regulator [Alphaproteobacteria bacterium]|nr:DtxR family transcriptional regulator [Alphaproteobacteria bacterium]
MRKDEEELLQLIWTMAEDGSNPLREELVAASPEENAEEILKRLVAQGYVYDERNRFKLTDSGAVQARRVVRSHRLAERLLNDVLGVRNTEREMQACEMEHALTDDAVDAICTLLGHPEECPHGKPIPPGPCCEQAHKAIERLFVPLAELGPGESGRVAYIMSTHRGHLDRLAALGIYPGATVYVHQRQPSMVLQVDETQLAVDQESVSGVLVRPLGRGPAEPRRHRHGPRFLRLGRRGRRR